MFTRSLFRRKRALCLAACLIGPLLGASPLSAIDTPSGSPEYLQEKFRPRWRFADLETVARELERQIERPVQLSSGAIDMGDLSIVLIERSSQSIETILNVIEQNSPLHCVAEPLRLIIQTKEEEKARRRRAVHINLREYGIFFRPRIQGSFEALSFDEAPRKTPFDFSGDEFEGELPFELEALLEELDGMSSSGESELRGNGAVLLKLTPEEESTIRTVLERVSEPMLRRLTWRVHFGFLSSVADTQGGLVSHSTVPELLETLDERETRTVAMSDGAWGVAQFGGAERRLGDLDVNFTGRYPVLMPVMRTPQSIRSLKLRVHSGNDHKLLTYEANWQMIREETSETKVISPKVIEPGAMGASLSKEGEVNSWSRPSGQIPESVFEISHSIVDRWDPEGEVFLPNGSALVLLGTVEGRSAAIVIEEVTP